MQILSLIGQSFFEALAMFWATLWALVLGFALSGAVQAFIPRGTMQHVLGDDDPASLGKATFFGMISSSCSYAASALAKSLFKGGANFTASMIFMFASTNLVLELGIVLWVLMGWHFAVAEFVGGGLMIVLFALAARYAFPRDLVESARSALQDDDADGSADSQSDAGGRTKVTERMKSVAGWADAAGYAMADITMLYKEMIFGFVVAGFLATFVPDSVWNAIFVTGYGFWTSLENVLVGPLIAVISFVCSVGNVPLAAALWAGGISFGGVASFIFADLITLPLILIYRKFYGTRLTIRLVATLWAVMSLTGLIIEYLFVALGLVPAHQMGEIAGASFEWDYTTFLNIVFLAVFAGLFWMSRNQKRLGGGAGYATDPMCGMQVEMANAPATAVVDNQTYYFCSDHCREGFAANHGSAKG
ncbi:permease [Salinisphaera orenii]|uniref:permease n=1 Tax=Salinisphaera orenii TaxID=856731 RepID=UPI000DBEA168